MLAPKRIKFRKQFKGRTRGIATRGNTVAFGEFGLMSLELASLEARAIVFLATGGAPALFTSRYEDWLVEANPQSA